MNKQDLEYLWNETPIAEKKSDTRGQMERLVMACEAALLFHDMGPWDDAKRYQWNEKMNALLGPAETRPNEGFHHAHGYIAARNEATTKNLCNAIRAALAHED